MDATFQQQLLTLLQSTILGLLGVGSAYLIYLAKQLAEKAKIQNSNTKDAQLKEKIDNAIDRLDDLVVKSVTATQLTLGESVKQSVIDGKVDKEELYALKDKVLIDVQSQLTNDGKDLLSLEISDLTSYISNLVELQLATLQGKYNK